MRMWLCLLAGLCVGAPLSADEPKKVAPKDYDDAILEHFKVKTDTPSLMKWLSDKSADDDTLLAIPDLIKQLGAANFKEREAAAKRLVDIGLPALWPLRDAMTDKDAERARLAKRCLERMDRGTHTVSVPPCAIRMLMKRKTEGLLERLLRYLPYTTDPEVEEDIYYDVDELRAGKLPEPLLKALTDKLPARRALAGCIVARVGDAEQKKAAERLLRDSDPNVRLRTAQGFLAASKDIAVPTLIDLLEDRSAFIAWQAEELLVWAACGTAPKQLVESGGTKARRAKAVWQSWRAKRGMMIDWQAVAKQRRWPWLGMDANYGHVYGSDGRGRWAPDLANEYIAGLTGDRMLTLTEDHQRLPPPNVVTCLREKDLSNALRHEMHLTNDDLGLIGGCKKKLMPNGTIQLLGSPSISIVGVEGRLLSKTEERGVAFGFTDGLVWNTDRKKKEYQVIDPDGGAVLIGWNSSGTKELSETRALFPFSRGRMLFTTGIELWSYDYGKPRRLLEFEDVSERVNLKTVALLRGGKWALGCTVYSAEGKVLYTLDSGGLQGTGSDFLPLLSFGFR